MANQNGHIGNNGSDRYASLMGSVYRQPPMSVGSPSIARHVLFWMPESLGPNRDVWVRNVERQILELYDNLHQGKSGGQDPSGLQLRRSKLDNQIIVEEEGKSYLSLFDRRYNTNPNERGSGEPLSSSRQTDTVRFPLRFGALPIKMEYKLHQENFTVTAVIDLSGRSLHKSSDPQARKLMDAFKEFNSFVASGEKGRAGVANAYDTIFHTVWDDLKTLSGAHFSEDRVGVEIADFKSLIVSRGHRGAFIAVPEGTRGQENVKRFRPKEQEGIVENLRPFVAHSGRPTEQLEYVFSSLNNGDVVYASTLGRSPSALQKHKHAMTEVFYATHGDRRKLGEMLDLGNALGVARISALYDVDELKLANQDLLVIEHNLRDARRDLPQIQVAGEPNAEFIQGVNEKLLGASNALARADERISGGIQNRVNLAQRYHQQFHYLLPFLGDAPIGDKMSYSSIIERRLEREYKVPSIVDQRYEQIQKAISGLTWQVQATELVGMQRLGVRLQELAEKEEAKERPFKRRELAIFFAFAAPYYASSVVREAIEPKWLDENPNFRWKLAVTTAVASLSLFHLDTIGRGIKYAAIHGGHAAAKGYNYTADHTSDAVFHYAKGANKELVNLSEGIENDFRRGAKAVSRLLSANVYVPIVREKLDQFRKYLKKPNEPGPK